MESSRRVHSTFPRGVLRREVFLLGEELDDLSVDPELSRCRELFDQRPDDRIEQAAVNHAPPGDPLADLARVERNQTLASTAVLRETAGALQGRKDRGAVLRLCNDEKVPARLVSLDEERSYR